MQADKHVGVAKGAELLSHLTAEERHSVLDTAAAQDTEDLEQFAKYVLIYYIILGDSPAYYIG